MKKDSQNKKPGRPKKLNKRNQQLAVMCTLFERNKIAEKALECDLTISEYLREVGLTGKVVIKTFPKEILSFTGTLNHLAANLNQIAKKRNAFDELNALDRARLDSLSKQIQTLANNIKSNMNSNG